MAKSDEKKGVSLAKGPVLLIGLALLIFGVLALIFGGHGFGMDPISGTENGKKFLGLEGNGWTNLLFVAAGALLVFGSPLHWGAKGMSILVGLALGAAALIALVDGDDVLGIFAANGLTRLVWGIAAVVLLILALLPRVGGKQKDDDAGAEQARSSRRVQRQARTVERDPTRERKVRFGRDATATRGAAAGAAASSRPRREPPPKAVTRRGRQRDGER